MCLESYPLARPEIALELIPIPQPQANPNLKLKASNICSLYLSS